MKILSIVVLFCLLAAFPIMIFVFLYSFGDTAADRFRAIQSVSYIVAIAFTIISLQKPLFLIGVVISVLAFVFGLHMEREFYNSGFDPRDVKPSAEVVCVNLRMEVICKKQNNVRLCYDVYGEDKTSVVESCEDSGHSFGSEEPIVIISPPKLRN